VCFGVFLLVDCYMSMTLNLILNSPYDAYKMRGSTYELNVFFLHDIGSILMKEITKVVCLVIGMATPLVLETQACSKEF